MGRALVFPLTSSNLQAESLAHQVKLMAKIVLSNTLKLSARASFSLPLSVHLLKEREIISTFLYLLRIPSFYYASAGESSNVVAALVCVIVEFHLFAVSNTGVKVSDLLSCVHVWFGRLAQVSLVVYILLSQYARVWKCDYTCFPLVYT